MRGGTFEDGKYVMKVEWVAPEAAAAAALEEWMMYAEHDPFVDPDWFGAKVNGLEIIGYNSRSPKNSIKLSGNRKCSPAYIRQEINRGNFIPAEGKQ